MSAKDIMSEMNKLTSSDRPGLAATSAEAIDQLSSILSAYNETTDKLYSSYERLQGEVKQLRKELKQKNEQLERKSRLAALGEMAAGMAHEIRNPLGGVQLYASLLANELKGQDKPLQWVHKISKGVMNLDTIVTDILAFTQDQACEKSDVHFMALLVDVMDYVQPKVKTNAVNVVFDDVDRELVVQVDVGMMRRVLLNLILNAIDAVDGEGIVRVAAELHGDADDYRVRICVSDTGEGIRKDDMSKIFNPFFTTKDTGTGLGLAIVHRLVESHGGIITASNGDDGGAVFTILLP